MAHPDDLPSKRIRGRSAHDVPLTAMERHTFARRHGLSQDFVKDHVSASHPNVSHCPRGGEEEDRDSSALSIELSSDRAHPSSPPAEVALTNSLCETKELRSRGRSDVESNAATVDRPRAILDQPKVRRTIGRHVRAIVERRRQFPRLHARDARRRLASTGSEGTAAVPPDVHTPTSWRHGAYLLHPRRRSLTLWRGKPIAA
ncbi:hypothetical protein K0M31_002154 [Melipona bicolor]|uniref:Uncharacterized protein n=1 Tax=Melipona bicolor TaxID=60889 RepID=A0AA40GH05_9HYME|nr:hypothetical protein K0M31_002154 [Melipona bicolor]